MPHISKKKSSQEAVAQAEHLLDSFLVDTGAGTRKRMFRELFTPTERIMLTKRLLMIYLIKKKVPWDEIEKFVGVSPSTVARFAHRVERGAFAKSLPFLRANTAFKRVLNFLADAAAFPLKERKERLDDLYG